MKLPTFDIELLRVIHARTCVRRINTILNSSNILKYHAAIYNIRDLRRASNRTCIRNFLARNSSHSLSL